MNLQINLRSPQTNSAFQKLFNLPPEEFLINDFTCHLKRKMPLQVVMFVRKFSEHCIVELVLEVPF